MEAVGLHAESPRPPGVHLHLEAVPTDVRQHGHLHRQRAPEPRDLLGPPTGQAVPETVPGYADAGLTGTAASCSAALTRHARERTHDYFLTDNIPSKRYDWPATVGS